MNWLGLFKRSPTSKPPPQLAQPLQLREPAALPASPQQVRQDLFDAVASGDESRLEALCHEHKELILQHGPGWLEVPPEFRASPELFEWYGNGLRAISQFCAEKLGKPEQSRIPVTSQDHA